MKTIYKVLLICFICFALVGCGTTNENEGKNMTHTQEQEEEQVTEIVETQEKPVVNKKSQLTIAMNKTQTFNPIINTQANVEQALYLIFSPLVNIEENGMISANLAKSWVVNPEQTAVTITLNDNITWHDGKPLTSDDVLFTLNQIAKAPESPYKQASRNIQAAEKFDDTTFKITYKQSFSGLLQTLFFPVIPAHIYGTGSQTEPKPVGSGPYMFDKVVGTDSIYLTANPNYFKGQPSIETIQIKLIPNEVNGLYSFKQGLIDIIYTTEAEWGKYTNSASNKAYEMIAPIYEFMGLNFNRALFQNKNVREALTYALDRDELVRLYYLEHATIADTPVSPSSYLYHQNLEVKKYDKEKARYLLAEEGYRLNQETGYLIKNGVPLTFTLMVNSENLDRVKVAKEMQKMYGEIGINLKIEEVDKETYLTRLQANQFDAFLGAWQLSYALDLSFAFRSPGSQNYGNFSDAQMNVLLQNAFVAPSNTVNNAYEALQEYFVETIPCISLYFKHGVLITKAKVGGTVRPTPTNIFANVEEWRLS